MNLTCMISVYSYRVTSMLIVWVCPALRSAVLCGKRASIENLLHITLPSGQRYYQHKFGPGINSALHLAEYVQCVAVLRNFYIVSLYGTRFGIIQHEFSETIYCRSVIEHERTIRGQSKCVQMIKNKIKSFLSDF